VHLLPNGFMQGRDGRSFDLADPNGLILAFQANAIDLPVDYEHQADNPEAKLKGPVPAAGWIKELQARDDGIWGRIEWTAMAAELIASKAYRFISPAILHHPKTREIMRLTGAGLVHRPNLHLPALNAQEAQMPPVPAKAAPSDQATLQGLLQTIISVFGLPANATADQVMAALKAVKDQMSAPPDPAKYMPVEAVQAMMADRHLELSTASEGRAQEKVNAAFRQGYIHGGMRDWALALCRSDEAAFDTFLQKSGPTFGGLLKNYGEGRSQPAPARTSLRSEAADSICAQPGLPMGALTK
jgi:phage I-like protein